MGDQTLLVLRGPLIFGANQEGCIRHPKNILTLDGVLTDARICHLGRVAPITRLVSAVKSYAGIDGNDVKTVLISPDVVAPLGVVGNLGMIRRAFRKNWPDCPEIIIVKT